MQSLNFSCSYPNSVGSEVSSHQQKTEPAYFLTAMKFLYLIGFGEGGKLKKGEVGR